MKVMLQSLYMSRNIITLQETNYNRDKVTGSLKDYIAEYRLRLYYYF